MSNVTDTSFAVNEATGERAREPRYLVPYVRASHRHGAAFASLLWASPETQAARFDAICRMQSPRGKSVVDLGCGRADFFRFCVERNLAPADYVGVEAVPTLQRAARDNAARARSLLPTTIVAADIVANPAAMFVGAELVIISGTLNTLDKRTFYSIIRRAYDAAAEMLVFNFLESPSLAAAEFLAWHRREDVLGFARTLSPEVRVLADYLDGDATIGLRKPPEE